MGKASVFRKVLLALGLVATVYASFGTDSEAPEVVKAVVPATAQQPLVSVTAAAQPVEESESGADGSDPFAPRNWAPPPPPPEPVKVAPPPQVVAVIVPEGPPPLPFQFMGRLNDGDDQVVYLGRGDQALVARMGEVLDSTYKVVGITAAQIEFEHIPTKQRQSLPLQSN